MRLLEWLTRIYQRPEKEHRQTSGFIPRVFRCLVTFLMLVITAAAPAISSTARTNSTPDTPSSNTGTSSSSTLASSPTSLLNLVTSSSINQTDTSAKSTSYSNLHTSSSSLLQCFSGDTRWSSPCGIRQKRSRYDEDLRAEMEGTRYFINDTKDFIFKHYITQPLLRSQLLQYSISMFPSKFSKDQDIYEKVTVNLYSYVANNDYLTTCGTNRIVEPQLKQKLGQINGYLYRSLCTTDLKRQDNHRAVTVMQWEDVLSSSLVDSVTTSSEEMTDIMIIYITINEIEKSLGHLEQLFVQ